MIMYILLGLGVLSIFIGRLMAHRGLQNEKREYLNKFGREKTKKEYQKIEFRMCKENFFYKKLLYLVVALWIVITIEVIITVVLFMFDSELSMIAAAVLFFLLTISKCIGLFRYNLGLKSSEFVPIISTVEQLNYGNFIIAVGFSFIIFALIISYID
ncbi:MAG: hypothetical protein ABF682_10295 [Liquorilactobacillus sp.]|uniref:hypothetical protein n=1 Tax=Liquorilactobacillus TaxID=2767888 RepID=UPI0039E95DDB